MTWLRCRVQDQAFSRQKLDIISVRKNKKSQVTKLQFYLVTGLKEVIEREVIKGGRVTS